MTPEEFRMALPSMAELYVVFSKLTHMPYLEQNPETMDDEVFAFTSQEAAEAVVHEMTQTHGKPVLAVRAENKDMLRLFGSMNLIGVTAICLSDQGTVIHVPMSTLVVERDMSNVPESQRPVTNKPLQTSMLYYLQERRNTQGQYADEDVIKELEEELLANIRRANYYVVFGVGEGDADKAEEYQLMLVNREGGDTMLPIFTDFGEIERFNRNQKLRFVTLSFDQVLQIKLPANVKAYLINPATTAFPVPREDAVNLLAFPANQ